MLLLSKNKTIIASLSLLMFLVSLGFWIFYLSNIKRGEHFLTNILT